LKPTLVTGATGFLGWHIARLLEERGHRVRALVRPGSKLRELAAEAVAEAARVARALGVRTSLDPLESTFAVMRDTAENRSSMLQDVRRGKRTEIDAMNGMISGLGKRLGIPTPRNDTLTALVKSI
jgi:2-dehydropantoate 2-reductase